MWHALHAPIDALYAPEPAVWLMHCFGFSSERLTSRPIQEDVEQIYGQFVLQVVSVVSLKGWS